MLESANEQVNKILKNHEASLLTPEVKQEIDAIIQKARKEENIKIRGRTF